MNFLNYAQLSLTELQLANMNMSQSCEITPSNNLVKALYMHAHGGP